MKRTPLSLLLALSASAFAGGAVITHLSHATSQDESSYASLGQLGRVFTLLENHYVDAVDPQRMLEGAIKGMVRELDPHSVFMPPDDYRVFLSETEGHFAGVGIEVDLRDELITVVAPIEGSPAYRAGVLPGDKVIAVDGQSGRGEPLDKLVRKLRGPAGTHVRLTVRRNGHEALLTFDLVREQIRVNSVLYKRLGRDILYLRLKQFQETTHDELLSAIGAARARAAAPLRGAILDLRNNPGGLVDQAASVADELLSGGVIYTTRHRGRTVEEARAGAGGALSDLPLAVLVNEYSASAAELVAGAVQDQKRGPLVGATTFGKGSVQSVLSLPGGAGLKLTTMRYYTPRGRSIQAQGVTPDVLVESPTRASRPLPPTRERDLEGHLAEEGPPAAASASPPQPPRAETPNTQKAPQASAEDETSPDTVERSLDVAKIPEDPRTGTDKALAEAYRLLVGAPEKAAATPHP